jgi:hypothetical protein
VIDAVRPAVAQRGQGAARQVVGVNVVGEYVVFITQHRIAAPDAFDR